MARFFIAIYRFLSVRKWLMYALLIVSSAVFVFYGLKVEYEENIAKLLPQTEIGSRSGLAFADLRVKDKIFLQFVKNGDEISAENLISACDEFVENLVAKDSASHFIDNELHVLGQDEMMNAMAFALENVPSFVDTALYGEISARLEAKNLKAQMAENYDLLAADETGQMAELVGQDPAALREIFLSVVADFGGGFSIVDGHFFAPDSTVAFAFISPKFKAFDSKVGTYFTEFLEKEIKEFEKKNPEIKILFHGTPIESVFNSRQTKKDLLLTVGLSLLVICTVLSLCFKNYSTLPMILLPVGYGTFFALACMYWIKGGMSLLAIGIGAIVLGVALSYCLHVVTHYKYVSDPERVLREQSTPVCLGCLTTIGAFLGLMFTQSELLSDFGAFASLALVGTTLFCLIFLPHFFSPEKNRRSQKAFALLDKINDFPLDRQKWLLILIGVVSAICFYTSSWVTFDNDLKNIGYNEPAVVASQKLLGEKLYGGQFQMYYATANENLDSALMSNQKLEKKLQEMKSSGEISAYFSAASLMPTFEQQRERIEKWKAYFSAEKVQNLEKTLSVLAAERGLLPTLFEPFYALLENDYAPSSLYEAAVLPEGLMSNFVEKTADKFMVFTSVQMPFGNADKVNNAVAAQENAVVIDPFFYANNLVEIINQDFNLVLLISSAFVFLVLLFSFKSLLLAVLAFIPMALSWYIVQGVMGIFSLQFNLINIIISTFIFGIGVDYSIFVMDGLLATARGKSLELLTFHKTAILFSAFVLIVVVSSLLLATHPAIKSIGVSTLIGMTSTVLITYALQPFLFRLMLKNKFLKKRIL